MVSDSEKLTEYLKEKFRDGYMSPYDELVIRFCAELAIQWISDYYRQEKVEEAWNGGLAQ